MEIINELAQHIIKTKFESFENDDIEQAKLRIIDIVGCIIGGAKAPGCLELTSLVTDWGGKEESSIFIHGGKVPASNAAWINSIMARSFDFGVLTPYIEEKPIWSHISETTVPTALTMAESSHASGSDLLTALILGDDLTTRISAASAYSPSVSWDSPGIVNKFGATAIASRLLGLNEHQLIHAFGIVLNKLAGSFQTIQDETHSFKLVQGLAARDGIIAAELAKKGWTAGKDALFGKFGYFSIYCENSNPEYLTQDLGEIFYGDETFKPYPCCRFTHGSIDCALKLVQDYDIDAQDIAKITIDVAPMHYHSPLNQPFEIGEFAQGTAIFSLRYNVANVLVRKCVKLEHYTEEMITDTLVGALAKKAEVTDQLPSDQIEATRVTVKMKDGQEYSTYVEYAKGNALYKPLSNEEIYDKYRDNVAFSKTVSQKQAETILQMLKNIEEIDDVTKITNLLVI